MGTKERKLRERALREQQIIEKAKELFLAKGYEATTVDEIAEALEISKCAFYLHFASKEELFFRIERVGLEAMYRLFTESTKKENTGLAKFGAIGMAYARFWKEYPELRKIANEPVVSTKNPNPGPERRQAEELGAKVTSLNIEAVQQGIKDGSIRNDLDPMLMAAIIGYATRGVLSGLEDIQSALAQIGKKDADVLGTAIEMFGRALEPHPTPSTIKGTIARGRGATR